MFADDLQKSTENLSCTWLSVWMAFYLLNPFTDLWSEKTLILWRKKKTKTNRIYRHNSYRYTCCAKCPARTYIQQSHSSCAHCRILLSIQQLFRRTELCDQENRLILKSSSRPIHSTHGQFSYSNFSALRFVCLRTFVVIVAFVCIWSHFTYMFKNMPDLPENIPVDDGKCAKHWNW